LQSRNAAPQFDAERVAMFSDSDRQFVDPAQFRNHLGGAGAEVVTAVARKAASYAASAFELIDPANQASPLLKRYANGRNIHIPECSISHVSNAKVAGTGIILSEGSKILPESTIREHHAYFTDDPEVIEIRNTEPAANVGTIVDEPTIILTGVFPLHFSHWMFDNFAKLTFIEQILGSLDGYKIAVGSNNLLDVYPDKQLKANTFNGIFPYSGLSPFGFFGRSVYARLDLSL